MKIYAYTYINEFNDLVLNSYTTSSTNISNVFNEIKKQIKESYTELDIIAKFKNNYEYNIYTVNIKNMISSYNLYNDGKSDSIRDRYYKKLKEYIHELKVNPLLYENINTNYIQSFDEFIKESPDKFIGYNNIYKYSDEDAYSFGYLKNDFIINPIGGSVHHTVLSDESLNKIKYFKNYTKYKNLQKKYLNKKHQTISRSDYIYPGRIWIKSNLISLWEYPKKINDFENLIYDLIEELRDLKIAKLNIKDLLIEVYAEKKSTAVNNEYMEQNFDLSYIYRARPDRDLQAIISVEDYKKFLDNESFEYLNWRKFIGK